MPTRTIEAERTARPGAVSRIGQRRQVVIPKKVFDALALAEGDFMEVTAENGRVAMKPKKVVPAGLYVDGRDAKKVRHAIQQLKAGKTRPWPKVKHDLGL
jgi:AbrB family looped-hinge helix DNA binding protein